jgi:very-short-patch-repair endonuclease
MDDDKLHKGADPKLFHYARQHRQAMTEPEKILWNHLRNRRLNGFKFRRQHPIADFIADFFCLECSLVVEVDGGYHSERDQKEYDEGRTYELSQLKIRVIRFTNREVMENIEFVLKSIESQLIHGRCIPVPGVGHVMPAFPGIHLIPGPCP